MEATPAGTIAMWAVLIVGFVGLAAFLYPRGELTVTVVGVYWFPQTALVLAGVFPPPWKAVSALN